MSTLGGIRTPRTGLRLDDPAFAVGVLLRDVADLCESEGVAPVGTLTVRQVASLFDEDPLDAVCVSWELKTGPVT